MKTGIGGNLDRGFESLDTAFPLEQAAEAARPLISGRTQGKLVNEREAAASGSTQAAPG
ncbi:MAG: hypothetical protein ACRDQZ_08630 [Mycobacteriales bacterium]